MKRDLGIWSLVLATGAFYFSTAISENDSLNGAFIAGMVITALYTFHHNRRDINFVSHYLLLPHLQMTFNYNLLVLPCSLALALNHQWLMVLAVHLTVSLIGTISWKIRGQTMLFLERFIPADQFEWLSGLRRNFYLVVLLVVVAIVLSPVKLFGLAALFLLDTVLLGFFSYSEPVLMLNPDFLDPADFLKRKIRFLNRIVFVIHLPLLLVNSFAHPESAWFALCFLLGVLLLSSSIIFIKYAHYQPNTAMAFNIDQLILFAGLLIPYLLPLSFYVYYSKRQKAITTLQHYQHDSN